MSAAEKRNPGCECRGSKGTAAGAKTYAVSLHGQGYGIGGGGTLAKCPPFLARKRALESAAPPEEQIRAAWQYVGALLFALHVQGRAWGFYLDAVHAAAYSCVARSGARPKMPARVLWKLALRADERARAMVAGCGS